MESYAKDLNGPSSSTDAMTIVLFFPYSIPPRNSQDRERTENRVWADQECQSKKLVTCPNKPYLNIFSLPTDPQVSLCYPSRAGPTL